MTERDLKRLKIRHSGGDCAVQIAMRQSMPALEAPGPSLFWLSGFNSSMDGTKASAIARWAETAGHAFTRFDYSGHGLSGGRLADGTIGKWLHEAETVFSRTRGPQVLIGSSMGGWIAALLAQRPAAQGRVAGLVLIAPAIDMSEKLMWQSFSDEMRQQILRHGVYLRASAYGDGPYPITRALIEEGRKHLFGNAPIALSMPVRIVHGMDDPDVPWSMSLDLVQQLEGEDVQLTLVKDGDHRLSRPQDLRLLTEMLAGLYC